MQFKMLLLAALAGVAFATPAQLEKRDCVRLHFLLHTRVLKLILTGVYYRKQRTVFFPDTCAAGEIACNGAGSITLCCTGVRQSLSI